MVENEFDNSQLNCGSCGAPVMLKDLQNIHECPYCGATYISDKAIFTAKPQKKAYAEMRKIWLEGWIAMPEVLGVKEKWFFTRWLIFIFQSTFNKTNFYFRLESRIKLAQFLNFDKTKLVENDFRLLYLFKALKVLDLSSTNVNDKMLVYISGLDNLINLSLGNTQTGDSAMDYFVGLTKLEKIYLHGTNVTEKGLVKLVNLPKLNEVGFFDIEAQEKIKMITVLRNGGAKLFGDAVSLTLNNQDVKDEDLKYLEFFPSINFLNLVGNNLNGSGLVNLKYCPMIEILLLNGNELSEESLTNIFELKRLKQLVIGKSKYPVTSIMALEYKIPGIVIH